MARRPHASSSTPEATTPEAESTEEITVTEAPAEAPVEEPTEAPVEEEKKTVKEFDLTAFNAAVEVALPERDTSTGVLPTAAVSPVQVEFRKLDSIKAKNAAKNILNDAMKTAMIALDITLARAYMQLHDSLVSAAVHKEHAERAPKDPTEAFVQKVATLRLALNLANVTKSDEIAEDWEAKVEALISESTEPASELLAWTISEAEDKGDEPDVTGVVKSAVKLALGKSAKVGGAAKASTSEGTGYTGERREISKHIAEAFENEEVGTFLTISEIKNRRSEEYGDNAPSAGAVSARLFPKSGKCTLTGVKPDTNASGHKGATKV